ncbi:pseudouridine synthase [Metallibacterium scheffleri]
MSLLRTLANLGYGSRREVQALITAGRVRDAGGRLLRADAVVAHAEVRVDGQPLDPAQGLVLMLHKPRGVTCSHDDAGPLVYTLLPPRYRMRKPPLSSIGRLDRDTSGLLLLTDDGALLHRIISPRRHVPKTYRVELAEDLRADAAALFASGTLLLKGERTPLLPAALQVADPRHAVLTLREGRYHQARRLFAAVGNHVLGLHREGIGALQLGDLAPGVWRLLDATDLARVFADPQDTMAAAPVPSARTCA